VTTNGGHRHRTLEERTGLYDRVNALRSQGSEIAEIATQLGMSRRDVSYWLRVNRPCRATYVPDLTPGPDLAYLVGAYLGDGRTAGEQDKKVRFNVADPEFANLLNPIVARVLRTEPKPVKMEKGFYCVNYDSAVLYDYLQQPLTALMPLVDSLPAKFLRGFFDAEGYTSPRLDHGLRRFSGVAVGVANTNFEYLRCIEQNMERLGMRTFHQRTHAVGEKMTIRGKTFVRKRDVHHLRIVSDDSVQTFQGNVGFSIPVKKQKLDDLIWIRGNLDPEKGYEWFISHYELRNSRWIRKSQQSNDL
jgi:intein-encoded DNA endonuclease-like protein